jgi:hypothetical protein
MYSRVCPWLLTWSDYEDDYEEDEGGFDDADANYESSPGQSHVG